MSGNKELVPLFMRDEPLPENYFEKADPYADPPKSKYNIKAMVRYAINKGIEVVNLSKEEANMFLLNQ